jgi:hypothetical protein
MPTSGTTNYSVTRDQVITRALRIVGAIGQGETPSATALSEASDALNQVVKEMVADGMQMWKVYSSNFAITAGITSYNIGIGATINQEAPNKVLYGFMRNTSVTPNVDIPMVMMTKQEYDLMGSKFAQSQPSQWYYFPPGAVATQRVGTFFLYPTPNTYAAANFSFYFTGMFSIQDFVASTDIADFPSFYYNTLVWNLADQLGFEYGVPMQVQGMITKKAEMHYQKALGFDMEEGSLYIMPDWQGWMSQRGNLS